MTALRSLAFNIAFYVNIIVLMIVGLPGYAAIAVVAGAIAVLTGVLSRRIVFRQLSLLL